MVKHPGPEVGQPRSELWLRRPARVPLNEAPNSSGLPIEHTVSTDGKVFCVTRVPGRAQYVLA